MSLGFTVLGVAQKKEPVAGPPFVAGAANNGLSVDPGTGKIVMGNQEAEAGDPAQWLSTREILMNNLLALRYLKLTNGNFVTNLAIDGLSIGIQGGIVMRKISFTSNVPQILNQYGDTNGVFVGYVAQP